MVDSRLNNGSGLFAEEDEGEGMTLLEHLTELRQRLIKAALAVAIGAVISFIFAPQIFDILKRPSQGSPVNFIYTEPAELLGIYFKVALISGLILAMPVVIYQIAMFVGPGLTESEKRLFLILMGPVTLLFAFGIAFGYFVALPPAFNFLFNFAPGIAEPQIKIGSYVNTMTSLLFWIGVSFQTPLIMYALARVHITNYRFFAKYRRYAIVVAFILGAIITPTFDPVNQTIIAIPIIVLYELGILLARLAR